MKSTTCPWCSRSNELHAPNSDAPAEPKPGDVSLCWACRGPAVLTDDGIRKPTDEELEEILADPGVQAALTAMATHATPERAAAATRTGGSDA